VPARAGEGDPGAGGRRAGSRRKSKPGCPWPPVPVSFRLLCSHNARRRSGPTASQPARNQPDKVPIAGPT
jgi:hypothetical protein